MRTRLIGRHDFLLGGLSVTAAAMSACGGGSGRSIAPVISSASPLPAPSAKLTETPTPGPAANNSANVVIGAKTSNNLTASFVGLSYEKSEISSGLFSGSDSSLAGCFDRLGSNLLVRLGGDSVDQTTYIASGAGSTNGQVAPADINALAAFLAATGWQVIYGINLGENTAQNAGAEASYVSQTLGANLFGFEIGSQPDLYASNGTRSSSYTFSDFIAEWQSYATQIKAAVPNAKLAGPSASSGNISGWTIPFASSEASKIILLTQHYYVGNGASSSSTVSELLTPDPSLPKIFEALQTAASNANLSSGYRMAETNSFYSGGAPGVSNALASALWALDYMMLGLNSGCAGFNFHGGGSGFYTPIADENGAVVEVRPEYYALLMTSQISPGPVLNVSTETGLPLTAYAVSGNDGALYVVLINKSSATAAAVSVKLPLEVQQATTLILTGTGLDSTTGTTLGGASISSSGAWSPVRSTPLTIGGSGFNIMVAAATAILIRCE